MWQRILQLVAEQPAGPWNVFEEVLKVATE